MKGKELTDFLFEMIKDLDYQVRDLQMRMLEIDHKPAVVRPRQDIPSGLEGK